MQYLLQWQFWLAVIVISFVVSYLMKKFMGGKSS